MKKQISSKKITHEVTCIRKDGRGRMIAIGGEFGVKTEKEIAELIDSEQYEFRVNLIDGQSALLETYFPIQGYPVKHIRPHGNVRESLLSLPNCPL